MKRGGVFIIALNRQLHMQPWGRHRENLWLVWDCSHLTEGKLLNEKFVFVWQIRYEKKKNTVSEIQQNANAPLQFNDFCMNLLDNCCCLDTDSQKKKSFQRIYLWAEGVTLWKSCSLFYLRDGLLSDVEILFATQQMQNSHQHCFMNNTNKAAQLPFQHE